MGKSLEKYNPKILPKPVFDHGPLVLDSDNLYVAPSPSNFENVRIFSPGFIDNIDQWWKIYQGNGVRRSDFSEKV